MVNYGKCKCKDCEYGIKIDDEHIKCNDGLHNNIMKNDDLAWEMCASRTWDWCKKHEEENAI